MPHTYFLGVDGGATACRTRLTDEAGRVLGEEQAGRANTRLGIARVYGEIETAARQALEQARLRDVPLSALHTGLGLAGLSVESDMQELMAFDHPFASVVAQTDAYIACLGAHASEDGGIFVFGTGSCGCAIVKGTVITVGGWGFQVSDQGSGAQVGLAALRRALLAHDGALPETDLTREVMAYFGNSPEKMILWAAEAEPGDYGGFAPKVVNHAAHGDKVASAIMRDAAEEAACLIIALHDKGAERIALVSSFSAHLDPWLPDRVRPVLVPPKGDALDGALLLARQN